MPFFEFARFFALVPRRAAAMGAISVIASLIATVAALPLGEAAWAAPPAARPTRRQIKGEITSVSRKIQKVQRQIQRARRSEQAIADDLLSLQTRLERTRARLQQARGQLARTQREQSKVQAALEVSGRRLRARENLLGRRMAANYRQGPVRYASVVLGSRSMGEFVSRAHFVRAIVRYDARLIAQIKADREDVLHWKRQLDQKAATVASLNRELAEQHGEETALVFRQQSVLAEAQERRAELERELDALARDSDAITGRLHALAATPFGRVRSLAPFGGVSGAFVRPVAGSLTSGFGGRFHPILKRWRLHTGCDFGAPSGAPIYAASGGVVVFSGAMRGYGNVVVIDHGGGLSTLYAHCSLRLAQEGQSVRRGEVIAHVGATGLATGPHLHFEVRRDGAPVDPMGVL